MFSFGEILVRAAGAADAGGTVGARIGGSAAAVFGPGSVVTAAGGGLAGSALGFAGSVISDLSE